MICIIYVGKNSPYCVLHHAVLLTLPAKPALWRKGKLLPSPILQPSRRNQDQGQQLCTDYWVNSNCLRNLCHRRQRKRAQMWWVNSLVSLSDLQIVQMVDQASKWIEANVKGRNYLGFFAWLNWPTCLLPYLPNFLPTQPPTHIPTYLPTYIPTGTPVHHFYLPTYLPAYPPSYLPPSRMIHLSTIFVLSTSLPNVLCAFSTLYYASYIFFWNIFFDVTTKWNVWIWCYKRSLISCNFIQPGGIYLWTGRNPSDNRNDGPSL